MDEARLIEKLRKIEALFAGATTDGERQAAARPATRIQERLTAIAAVDPPSSTASRSPTSGRAASWSPCSGATASGPTATPASAAPPSWRASRPGSTRPSGPSSSRCGRSTWLNDATERVVRLVTDQDSTEAEVVEAPALDYDDDDEED
ncbi:MAG: hypothetical protein R3F43_19500 [bacterium]